MKSKLAIFGGTPVLSTTPPIKSSVGKAELAAVNSTLADGVLSAFRGGPRVRAFEKAFAAYVGTSYAVATTSGTTALHASLSALGLQKGDEVLVPAMTFVSTASVALQENLSVVFVDIDEYFCMDVDDLKSKITSKSKAIIPVHLYGQSARMREIMEIAAKHSLFVIEDACQAHGALDRDKKTGNLGDVGCFSFFETKNMTCGEGGMITTSNKKFYEQICLRREHGSPRNSSTWYDYKKLGYNYNMTELQGAIGLAQLAKLDDMNAARKANAALYSRHLKGLGLDLPKIRRGSQSVFHNYPVLLPKKLRSKRAFFVDAMRAEGIPIDIAYPTTLYQTELFVRLGIDGNCPFAEDASSRLFTLFTDSAINETVIMATSHAIQKILMYLKQKDK